MYYKEVQQMLFFTWFVALDKALLKMCDTSGFWAHAIYLWLSAWHCWSVMTVCSTRCFPNVLPAWPAFFIRPTLFILSLNKTTWVTPPRWFVFHFKLNCGHKHLIHRLGYFSLIAFDSACPCCLPSFQRVLRSLWARKLNSVAIRQQRVEMASLHYS